MSRGRATLHAICGKIAAGKSTLALQLSSQPNCILMQEDKWLAQLYPGEQNNLDEYVRNSARLRNAIGPHIVDLLGSGLSVVLDFPANTPTVRLWFRDMFEKSGSRHQLHYVETPDEECKKRLRKRNSNGEHEFVVSDDEFELFTSYFVEPTIAEGFNIVKIANSASRAR